MKSTRANITYILVSLISIVILASSAYQYSTQREVFIRQSEERLSARVDLLAGELTTMFAGVARDLFILRDLPQMIAHINAYEARDRELKRQEIEDMFRVMSLNKEMYDQIRFINRRGIEVVRVDNHGNGPETVDVKHLQNKSHRYYFKEAMKIGYGEIYVSQMDLNVEYGEIEVPYKPIIRYASPVFDYMHRKVGIVILNVKADYMLNLIRNRQHQAGKEEAFYLLNKDGYYLVHPDKSKEWGFMLGNSHRIINDEPGLVPILNNNNSGKATLFNGADNSTRFYAFNMVYPYVEMPALKIGNSIEDNNPSRGAWSRVFPVVSGSLLKCRDPICWKLIYSTNAYSLIPSFKELTFGMGLFFGGLLVTAIVLSYVFAWRQSRPIQLLSTAASKIASGDFSVRADIRTADEIGRLGHAFNVMAETLQEREEQEKTFQRMLQEETVRAQEEERHNLAQDIHDNLGHSLAIANMKMQAAKSRLPSHATEISGSLDEGIKLVKDMIKQTRSLIFDLYPVMLDDFGIVKTLENQVQTFSARTGLKAGFKIKGSPGEPQRTASLYLLRAIKELLNNSFKYAETDKVFIEVFGSDNMFGVIVEDEGKGFDVPEYFRSHTDFKRIGLISIKEKIKRFDGHFIISSTAGKGTRIEIRIPYKQQA